MKQLSGSDSHQAVMAVLKEKPQVTLKEFVHSHNDTDRSLVLLLDDIQDPQNLGSILRAAECFAVDLVIYSKNKGSSITAAVTKASVGASELLKIMPVSNLVDVLRKLRNAGFWLITADADLNGSKLADFRFPLKSVIVLGSEGRGVQPLIKKEADFSVYIELFGKISSLNVSQAAAIMLNAYRCAARPNAIS